LQPAEVGVAVAEDFAFCFAQGGAAFESLLVAGAEELVERFYEADGFLDAGFVGLAVHKAPFSWSGCAAACEAGGAGG
jgi:hypothetical protein